MTDVVTRKAPTVAGVALIAADTGRMLMLQRGLDDDDDPAAGRWEWPGGHLEASDDSSLHGGLREWEEEVGRRFPKGGTVEHTWTSGNGVYQGHVVVIDREDQVNLAGRRTVSNADDDYSEQAAWWRPEDARKNPALRRECRAAPWADIIRISRRASRSTGQKDLYASMAPMPYVRGLGASPSRPRQSPPPTIVERRRGPSLRGQVRRLKRRSRRAGVKGLTDARARLSTKQELDPGVAEILRVASGQDQHDRNLTRVKTAIARLEAKAPQQASGDEVCMVCGHDVGDQYDTIDGSKHGFPGMDAVVCLGCADPETKGAPSRMPAQLMAYWSRGAGLARWNSSPRPWRTLRALLRRYGVGGMSVDGATSNVFHRARGYWPSERNRGGRKSLEDAFARL